MKSRIYILLLFTLAVFSLSGQSVTIQGVVRDSSQTVPYATVSLKSHPDKGVIAASDGRFTLKADSIWLPDTLVVSFVGYHPLLLPIAPGKDTLTLTPLLRQNVIELGDAVVTAKAKKKYKVDMKDLLGRVREQFNRDFSHIEALYRVQTNTSISSSNKILAYQENLVETYDPGREGRDMTRRIDTKVYFDKRARERMLQVDTLRHVDPTVDIKGLTVSERMIREYLAEKPKKWQYVGQVDGEIILTYFDMLSFLGMFRYGQQCVLYIDSENLSIRRAEAIMTVYVNIPFGKKLPKDLLPMVNVLNVSDKEFDSFRLKKMEGEFRMSSRFVKRGESLYRGDSYSQGKATLTGGKNALYIGLKSEVKILDIATQGVKPITEAQTKEKPKLIVIDNL